MCYFGFQDQAEEAGSSVTGGQTVINPWLTIGGVATTVSLLLGSLDLGLATIL